LYYLTYHFNPHVEENPKKFIYVAKENPSGDLFSSDMKQREIRVNRVTQLEIGIRQMDHILEKTRTKERGQLAALDSRAQELTQLFLMNFSTMTPKEFEQAQERTIELLAKAGLNPDRLINDEKTRITEWLVKASGGRDSLNRQNLLVSKLALDAVRFHIQDKLLGTNRTEEKFVTIREILIIEREKYRAILTHAMRRVQAPDLWPTRVYQNPELMGKTIAALINVNTQLDELHANPYRSAALHIKPHIFHLLFMIRNRRKQQEGTLDPIIEVSKIVNQTFDKTASEYPGL
jgi:hypothetical protein